MDKLDKTGYKIDFAFSHNYFFKLLFEGLKDSINKPSMRDFCLVCYYSLKFIFDSSYRQHKKDTENKSIAFNCDRNIITVFLDNFYDYLKHKNKTNEDEIIGGLKEVLKHETLHKWITSEELIWNIVEPEIMDKKSFIKPSKLNGKIRTKRYL